MNHQPERKTAPVFYLSGAQRRNRFEVCSQAALKPV